jgi:hypothetical protein
MGGAPPSARRPPPVAAGPIPRVRGGGRLASSPLRLSQDFNIFSTFFTDGAGRLRYIPDAQVDRYLASIGGLSLRYGTIASGGVQLRRCGEPPGNNMSHRDHTQVPPSHAARDIPGKPTARDYAVEPASWPVPSIYGSTSSWPAGMSKAKTVLLADRLRRYYPPSRCRGGESLDRSFSTRTTEDSTPAASSAAGSHLASSCTIGIAIPCALHLWWALSFHVASAPQTGGRDPLL